MKILDAQRRRVPAGRARTRRQDPQLRAAVGEICRVAADTGLFQGYFDNPEANTDKYRDGVYHSGDLGHVLVRDGTRFLFFDGRTDDWIRKDGENFSAGQVGRIICEHPDVALAAAYGVPCAVSDELVMAAIKLREGARFDPQAFFEWCETQVSGGSMDRKWFPDFVRLVDDFEYTQTQKVLVRNLKKVHFDRRRLPRRAALLAAPRRHGLPAVHGARLRHGPARVRRGRAGRAARPLSAAATARVASRNSARHRKVAPP